MKIGLASAALLAAVIGIAIGARGAEPGLEAGFADPPREARPWVFWWWLESNVSKAGITRDLEEMKSKGIAGALLFDAGSEPRWKTIERTPAGPTFMSPEWRELFKHALKEANRLGLDISVNLCSGWNAGGKWITPEYACRKDLWSETQVTGPLELSRRLAEPSNAGKDYRDIAVLAYRTPEFRPSRMRAVQPRVTASSATSRRYQAAQAMDNDLKTFWVSRRAKPGREPAKKSPEWIQFEFKEPFNASALFVAPRTKYGPHICQLQSSKDGRAFTTISRFRMVADKPKTIEFKEVSSRIFRLVITSSHSRFSTRNSVNVQIAEIELLQKGQIPYVMGAGITDLDFKAGRKSSYHRRGLENYPGKNGYRDTEKRSVIDLSAKMDSSGRLVWSVPRGNWKILRFGHTTLGARTKTSSRSTYAHARGGPLEMDWLSARAMDYHFEATGKKLISDAGKLAGGTLKYLHDDSWEVGCPNWTESFRADFKKFRGYDLLPYLPVLAGKIVDSREVSNRFLHDYRRTIADCLSENHYRRFRDLCKAHGIGIDSQGGGPWTTDAAVPMDTLANLGKNDIPHGEFWHSGWYKGKYGKQNLTGKQTASAAHIYGRKYAASEAFTSIGTHWEESPSDLKPTADISFCEGINRFYLHTFTHSPPHVGKPGYEYFAGTHFNPNITWWAQAGAWTEYIARCQWLLSRGMFVGDVCYYYGDDTPSWVPAKHVDPSLGPGYDYDVCNAEVLLARMSVKDGRIVLPDGMSYRLLVLPDTRAMPVRILRKLKQLVEAGATVAGPKPQRDSGLKDYPQCDRDVQRLADELWGDCDGLKVKLNKHGRGRIVWGMTIRDLFRKDSLPPDFEYPRKAPGVSLDYIHRRDGDTDIYYVCNREDRSKEASCTFRVSGKRPELWDPITGEIRLARAFKQSGGRTTLPLELAPYGSVFVVFRKAIPQTQSLPGRQAGGKAPRNFPKLRRVRELGGPWTVKFDPKWGGPGSVVFDKLDDWTKRPEKGIKYYSGKATYYKSFDSPGGSRGSGKLHLDLKNVAGVAQVRLNGKDLGVVWTAPWRVDISKAVKPTANKLEIDVVNLWPNRLIGDAALPRDKRLTTTNVTKFKANSRLMPSGLLGPVTLKSEVGSATQR